jgi:DNA-binding response OmpR family regulator
MRANCERAHRMQPAVSDEKETGVALRLKPSVMFESLRNSGVGSAAESKSSLLARFSASPSMSSPKDGEAGPIRVLIVEDDENYREIVASELSWHGFTVRSFADGDALLGSLDTAAEADVIVLDWRLPTISGIDLLPQLRRRGVNLPVVFLTSNADPAYEKLAFERGALDFIDKTRGVEILASRLRLAAKSGKPAATPEAKKAIVCGKLVLSPSASRAYWNEVDVGLTVSEYTTSSIFWRRTSVTMRLAARSTTSNITKASLPGKGIKDIGQTFDHRSSVSVASSAKLIRPLAKSRTPRLADIAGEV